MKKLFHILLTVLLITAGQAAQAMAIAPAPSAEPAVHNFFKVSGDLAALETLKAYQNKNNLRFLDKAHPDKITAQQELLQYIKAAHDTNAVIPICRALHMCRDLFSQQITLEQFINRAKYKRLVPTLAHLYVTDMPCGDSYFKDQQLTALIERIIQEEATSLEEEGYYTYIHAHRWSLNLVQRIYAELLPSSSKDFFPLHFLTLIRPPDNEPALVNLLLKSGSAGDFSVTLGEKYLLSVNTCFFGNMYDKGESTSDYFFSNRSVLFSMELDWFFDRLGHAEIYTHYATELTAIAALHKDASKYGKLWIIKIPKAVHQQVVIPTLPYGHKTKFVIDGEEADDVNYIQDTLRTRPHAIKNVDEMQFRILMTPSTGLNPDLGIKTIPLHCADPVKYAEFETKFNALMTKIKADIEAKKTATS